MADSGPDSVSPAAPASQPSDEQDAAEDDALAQLIQELVEYSAACW